MASRNFLEDSRILSKEGIPDQYFLQSCARHFTFEATLCNLRQLGYAIRKGVVELRSRFHLA